VRGGLVVCLACAGCFAKPPAPLADGPHGSGADAGPGCARFGSWDATPTAIPVAVSTNDAATSPWLSDSRTDLYFTILTNGDPGNPTIVHSTFDGSLWSPPQAVVLGSDLTALDNPFLADDGALWFDGFDNGPRTIFQAAASPAGGFAGPVPHPEVAAAGGGGKEPSVAPDGTTVYFSDAAGTQLWMHATGSAASQLATSGSLSLEAPSIGGDGALYFSEFLSAGDEVIASATVSAGALTGVLEVPPFQTSGLYFDPNASRDGKTLVFSAKLGAAAHSSLYYVTRECL